MVRTSTLGVAGVVRFGQRVLIGKRGVDCKLSAGLWSFPGGRVEDDELIAAAVIRELKEETALAVQHIYGTEQPCSTTHPFAITDHLLDDYYGKKYNHVTHWYNLVLTDEAIADGKIKPVNCEPTKCEGWHWMTWKEIAELPNINDPNHPQYLWVPLKTLLWGTNT